MKLSLTVAVFACVAVVSAIPLQKRQDPADLGAQLEAQLQGLGEPQDLLAGQPAQPPADPAALPPADPAALPPADPAAPPPPPPQDPNAQAQPVNDVNILNFALSLEHLEAAFYAQGLDKFSEADFRRENIPNPTQTFQNFYHILQHEAQHVKTLQTVITSLGGTPVPPCEYQFPFQTVRQFMGIANSLEKVGVSAYDGALAIMESGDLQTAAATIATVEARHASFLQTANGGDPFPENFDVPLDGREIITLASPFIKSCPFDLGFVPFGQLQIKKQIQLPESDVECTFQPAAAGAPLFCNWLFSDQSIVSPLNGNLCRIPLGARGDVYLAITNDQTPLSLKKTDTIVAGPAIVTVDTAHTDSCKKLFSGKKMKDGKLNQPMDHGPVPVNVPSKDFSMIPPVTWEQTPTPTPAGTPPGQENAIVEPTPVATTPPSPENAVVVPPPVVPTPVEVKDPEIQSLFDEIQACSTPTPVDAIPAPTPTTTPELALGVPPELIGGVPPAYGATPPPPAPENAGSLPPPAPENAVTPPPPMMQEPPAYGAEVPPAPELATPTPELTTGVPPTPEQTPPAYGAEVPPAPELAPPNPENAVTVPPPAPENAVTPPPPMMQEPPAYGAEVPPAPELATPTPELTTGVPPTPEQTYGGELPPTDLTGAPTYGSDPNAPPVIEGMDNLTTEEAAPSEQEAEFPVLVL